MPKEIKDYSIIIIKGKLNFSIHNDELLKLTNFDVSDVNMWTWQIFLQDNLGIGWNICDFSDDKGITAEVEYEQMPVYPEEGSIKVINGIAVVKLSY